MAHPVYLYATYDLIVKGVSSTSIGGSSGPLAQSAGGAATDQVLVIRESDLAGPNLTASMGAATRARIMRSWPYERAYAARVMRGIEAARHSTAAVRTVHHGTAAVRVHQATAGLAQPAPTSATAQPGAQSATVDAAISSLVVSSTAQHLKP